MATAAAPTILTLSPGERALLPHIGWEGYEALLRSLGDGSSVRLTYDRGDLELMSPSLKHEEYRELTGLFVRHVAVGLRIPCRGAGSTTWRRQAHDRGLEADACFFLASFPRVKGKKEIHLDTDPPPDLAIEIEITRSALDRMGVYAALGVPEVWRFDGETLCVEVLQEDGAYAQSAESPSFPFLSLDEVVHWVRLAEEIEDETEWLGRLQEWVRDELAPRLEGGRGPQ